MDKATKPLFWIGDSLKVIRLFPVNVRRACGYALSFAQKGEKHPFAKPLTGFRGAGVLEIIEDQLGDTYRVVYTVRFAKAVFVLHAFKKKSKRGIATPQKDLEMIRTRLKTAEAEYQRTLKGE